MTLHEVEQGSAEWDALRSGRFTASRFGDLFMAKSTKGYNNLINEVVFKRLTGEEPEGYQSDWMIRGTELEPTAREAYETQTFRKARKVGFIELDEWTGCSPDGLIGEDGILEIKCPKFSTLIDYHLTRKVPTDYYWQMMGEMYITGRKWCDLFVWHPTLKPLLTRVERCEKDVDNLKNELYIAIEEAKRRINKIRSA
jgi:putative phage-type endonuclease